MREIIIRDMQTVDLMLLKAPDRVRHFFAKHGTRGPAFTGYAHDGDETQGCFTILFSCGLQELHDGVAEAWAVLGEHAHLYGNVGRTVRALLEPQLENYHRIHATVRSNESKSIRFLEYLRFKREAWLEQYGADRHDHILYALVRDPAPRRR